MNSLGALSEFSKTIHWGVFLVEIHVRDDSLLGLANDGQRERHSIVVTKSFSTEVNLYKALDGPKLYVKTKDRVGWGHWFMRELAVQKCVFLHFIILLLICASPYHKHSLIVISKYLNN